MTASSTSHVSHDDLLVIEGLVFFSDGDPAPLRQGNVAAANVTTATFLDLAATIDVTGQWLKLLSAPNSPWLLVRSASDIELARSTGRVGFIMGWQNSDPFGSSLDRVHVFHALGLRVAQLTYNQANLVGDGCLEKRNSGLTVFGKQLVEEMNQVGIAVDLSHSAENTCLDAAKTSKRPVILSHANAYAVDARPRNKSDEVLRAVAATGGVIGVSVHGFMNWNGDPKSPPTLDGFIRHIRHVGNLVGYEHVGIGNDFAAVSDPLTAQTILDWSKAKQPGATSDYIAAFGNSLAGRYPSDTPSPREMGKLTLALSAAGLSGAQIEGIVGRNFLRTFGEIWR